MHVFFLEKLFAFGDALYFNYVFFSRVKTIRSLFIRFSDRLIHGPCFFRRFCCFFGNSMNTKQNVFNAILNDGHPKKSYLLNEMKRVFETSLNSIFNTFPVSRCAIKHFGKVVSAKQRVSC